MIELNPLEILREREVKTLPPQFSKIKISNNQKYDKNILGWIRNKLSGRYCVVSYPAIDSDDKFKASTYIGFEEQKELTYFMLACQYLRRN